MWPQVAIVYLVPRDLRLWVANDVTLETHRCRLEDVTILELTREHGRCRLGRHLDCSKPSAYISNTSSCSMQRNIKCAQ